MRKTVNAESMSVHFDNVNSIYDNGAHAMIKNTICILKYIGEVMGQA